MSEYEKISLRKINHVEGLEKTYAFTASAFCGPHALVVNADPAEILSITRHVPGYKREPVGNELAQYRFERLLAQDAQCPIVMPSIGVPFHSGEKSSLYDTDLVNIMVEKGVQKMPFCLIGLDEEIEAFLKTSASSDAPVSLDDVYRPSIDPEEFTKLPENSFTISFHMEELIQSIDAHYTQHMRKYARDDNKDFYSAFPQCRDYLDVLIATGCQYLSVERYWEGESILSGIKNYLVEQQKRIGTENPSSIELIDRFALLHERKISKDHAATASYMGVIEDTAETKLNKLAKHLAEMILSNENAREMVPAQLSPLAQSYFRSLGATGTQERVISGPDIQP